MSKIDELLDQYSNSLEDFHKIVSQLPGAFNASLKPIIYPRLFTAQEAKDQLGIDLSDSASDSRLLIADGYLPFPAGFV